jgi:hypothetical protein
MCLKAEKVFATAVHDELPQIASNIGQQLSVRANQIEFDIAELRNSLLKKLAELNSARTASERATSYDPVVDGDVRWPNCHISDDRFSALVTVGSAVGEIDNYHCRHAVRILR